MIEKRHDTTVPAAMLRGRLRNKAMECPECGAPVFRYKGSYRKRCPNCGHQLSVLSKRAIKRSGMNNREQIESLVQEIVGDRTTPGDAAQKALGINPKAREAKILNSAMGHVNTTGLLDSYVGQEIDSDGANLKLYFSQSATNDELKTLMAALSEMQVEGDQSGNKLSVSCQKSDSPGAAWVVVVRQPTMGQPQVRGAMGVQGPASGELAVQRS